MLCHRVTISDPCPVLCHHQVTGCDTIYQRHKRLLNDDTELIKSVREAGIIERNLSYPPPKSVEDVDNQSSLRPTKRTTRRTERTGN